MKKLLIAFMLCMPLASLAQNTWEAEDAQKEAAQKKEAAKNKTNPDQKYLAGAVPEVDGRVVWTVTLQAPGKTAQQVYNIIGRTLSKMVKEEGQFEQSGILLADTATHKIVANFQEWLVFKDAALALDRTRLMYHLMADCKDGSAEVTMTRIHYLYEEERDPQVFYAESWITDKYALNKKQDKLARISGKFRRKTIDRKDFIFNKLQTLLNE